EYTVAQGHETADLDYTGTSALSLNGGTIRDAAENDAVLTLPAPGGPGSLGDNKDIAVDGIVPVISETAPPGISEQSDTRVSYTLSESVASGTITWTRTGGSEDASSPHAQGLAGSELNAGAHTDITLANDPALVDGAMYTVAFDAADAGGNNAATVENVSVAYDFTAPAVSAYDPANGETGVDPTQDLALTFDENVFAAAGNVVIKETGGDATVETIAITAPEVSIVDNVVTVNPQNDLGFNTGYYVFLDAGCLADAAGNPYAGIQEKTTWAFTTMLEPEDYAYWTEGAVIDINTTPSGADVPAGVTVENFPVLVRLEGVTFPDNARAGGADIRFCKLDLTPLPYEIEHWDDQEKKAEIWVKLDAVEGNTEAEIKMIWGKPDAESRSDPSAVFSNGFAGVWHLDEDGTAVRADASASGSDLTPVNYDGDENVAGIINGADHGDGGEYLVNGTSPALQITGSITLSTWIYGYDANNKMMAKHDWDGGARRGYSLHFHATTGQVLAELSPDGTNPYYCSSANNCQAGMWNHVVFTWDAAGGKWYMSVNGVWTDEGSYTLGINNTSADFALMTNFHDGQPANTISAPLDECRVSNVHRDRYWVKLCYENQKQDQTLVTVEPTGTPPMPDEFTFYLGAPGAGGMRMEPTETEGAWTTDRTVSGDPFTMNGNGYFRGLGAEPPYGSTEYNWALFDMDEALGRAGLEGSVVTAQLLGAGGHQDGSGSVNLTIRTSAAQAKPSYSDWKNKANGVTERWYCLWSQTGKPVDIDLTGVRWLWLGTESDSYDENDDAVWADIRVTGTVQYYDNWTYFKDLYIDTRPEGADVSGGAADFPLLVHLYEDNFPFDQAQAGGGDLLFTDVLDGDLPYEIVSWDEVNKSAQVWVKVPYVAGNTRNTITMRWGNPDAAAASNPAAVFGPSNGYAGAWHFENSLDDATGVNHGVNSGTTDAQGRIGRGRRFDLDQMIQIPDHSSLDVTTATFCAWIIPHTPPSDWTSGQPRIWDRVYNQAFSVALNSADYTGTSGHSQSEPGFRVTGGIADAFSSPSAYTYGFWHLIAVTFENGTARFYINGEFDREVTGLGSLGTNNEPAYIGNRPDLARDYDGDMDEIRLSSVARDANWIKLVYENQRMDQNLVSFEQETQVALNRDSDGDGVQDIIEVTVGGPNDVTDPTKYPSVAIPDVAYILDGTKDQIVIYDFSVILADYTA
ncbi:MAG: DUF2341 domain-containing protein, partial [Chitinivibrionales bacterium]|nr:DUF2341 domain-containing protein [Chitinivibrionales bacterium]